MNTQVMFSSKKEDWGTPQDLFNELDREFCFTLDAAANEHNHKCVTWLGHWDDGSFTNGLTHEWTGTVWCNPPYNRDVGAWVKKASESRCTTVMLLAARTSNAWFHDYIYNKPSVEVRFIRGRLKFEGAKSGAPFPSMIVIFRQNAIKDNRVIRMDAQEGAEHVRV